MRPTHRPLQTRLTTTLLLTLTLLLGGCFATSGDDELNLGSVSVGQQLIDLKKARDADAMTEREYHRAKAALLDALQRLSSDDDDDDDDDYDDDDQSDSDPDEDDTEDDDDNDWLF